MSSGIEECKKQAWARDKVFPSPDRLIRRRGILRKVLLQCFRNTETNTEHTQDLMHPAEPWILIPDAEDLQSLSRRFLDSFSSILSEPLCSSEAQAFALQRSDRV
jgi:hypothetical protein